MEKKVALQFQMLLRSLALVLQLVASACSAGLQVETTNARTESEQPDSEQSRSKQTDFVSEELATDTGPSVTGAENVPAKNPARDQQPLTVPVTSVPEGLFNAPFALHLSAHGDDRTVSFRYTLNGAAPLSCNDGLELPLTGSISMPAETTVLRAIACDQAGQASSLLIRTYQFDNVPPSSPSVLVATGGYSAASASTVTLQLSALGDPVAMRISSAADCSSGSWEPYAETKAAWPLSVMNGTNTISAKFRDSTGNESVCISTSVIHDNNPPLIPVATPGAQAFHSNLLVTIAENATADANLKDMRYTINDSDPTCESGTVVTGAVEITAGANRTLKVIACDHAGQSSSMLTVIYQYDAPPSISLSALSPNGGFSAIGDTITVNYTANDPDDDAQIRFYVKTSATGACAAGGTLIGGPISEDAGFSSYMWSTAGMTDGLYYVCASITDNKNPAFEHFSVAIRLYNSSVCTWTGETDTNWDNLTNYQGCGSVPDTSSEWVLIHQAAFNMPTVSVNRTIAGFAAGRGGGIINVAASRKLTLANTATTVQSSVKMQGPATGALAELALPNAFIINGATLTIGSALNLTTTYLNKINVGSSSAVGHFTVDHAESDSARWPHLYYNENLGVGGFLIEGPSSAERSTLSISGLKVVHDYSRSMFSFVRNYEILRFDNIIFDSPIIRPGFSQTAHILLANCSSAEVRDTTWDNLTFKHYTAEYLKEPFVDFSACSALPEPIKISGQGAGYTSVLEKDPNNLVDWVDETSTTPYDCVFSGSGQSASWFDPANWSTCNDRRGHPDSYDTVRIPTGLTVEINGSAAVREIAAGAGGGKVVIFSESMLQIVGNGGMSSAIKSDLMVEGATGASAANLLSVGDLVINNNARLTLGKDVRLRLTLKEWDTHSTVRVGDGTSAGQFFTNGGTVLANFPSISSLGDTNAYLQGAPHIQVQGASGQPSVISLNGFNFSTPQKKYHSLEFLDHYTINVLSYVNFGNLSVANKSSIKFTNCTNALFTAVNWSNLTFGNIIGGVTAYNVDFSGTSCDGAATINVSGSGGVYGATYENDPNIDDIRWL